MQNMSIVQSIRGEDQLVLNGCRYRQDRLVQRCIKDNRKGCARFDAVSYEIYKDQICQAPSPNETEKVRYTYELRKMT
jgi:hypothetical protein